MNSIHFRQEQLETIQKILGNSTFRKFRHQLIGTSFYALASMLSFSNISAFASEMSPARESVLETGPMNDVLTSESASNATLNEAKNDESVSPVLVPTSAVAGSMESRENDFWTSLSEDEIRSRVLLYTQMSEEHYQVFVNSIIQESMKSGNKHIDETEVLHTLYMLSYIPMEEKYNSILVNRGINVDLLNRLLGVVLAESAWDGQLYWSGYSVATTIDDRSVSDAYGEFGNVYSQAFAKNQFVVTQNGRMKKFIGRSDLNGYLGGIDELYLGSFMPMHAWLDFRCAGKDTRRFKAIFTGIGNRYGREMSDQERARRYVLPDNLFEVFSSYYDTELYLHGKNASRTLTLMP